MDNVIHSYRRDDRSVSMFPSWAYGLFQSKDAYESQAEVLNVGEALSAQSIFPLDSIVQAEAGGFAQGDLAFRPTYTDIPRAKAITR